MFAAEIGRMAGVRIPVVPMSHEYLVTQPFRERDPADPLPTLRDPDLLVYFREEGGGLVMGGYERHSRPAFLPTATRGFDAIPPDFNGRLLEDDWDRFEEIVENSRRRVPQMEDVKVTRMINGPEGVHARQRVLPGRDRGARAVRGRRLLRARPRGRGRHRQGDGRVDRRGRAVARPLAAWTSAASARQYRSPTYTLKRVRETYETYYDIRYPGHERESGRPLRVSAANAWHREHGAAFGEKSGWERVNWYESQRRRGRRVAAPARLGGPALVARDRRRAPRLPRGRGALRRELVREARDRRARARPSCSSGCATTGSRATSGRITYTQMLNRRGGIECDFTVARLAEERFGDRHRHGVRQPRPRVDPPPPARRRLGAGARRDLAWACFGIWGPRARDVLAPLTPQSLASEDFPYMSLREITVGDVPVRALRVTYVGELGWELYCPDRVRARAVARAVGGGRGRTASWPAATARSTRCGSRRATASGARTSRPTRPRTRAASASA